MVRLYFDVLINACFQKVLLGSFQQIIDSLDLQERLRPKKHIELGAIRTRLSNNDNWLLTRELGAAREAHLQLAGLLQGF